MYKPKEYWNKVGRSYKPKTERGDELFNLERCVREYTSAGDKLLEVGSGNGRLYLFLQNRNSEIADRFEMCDFVDSFRQVCKRNTGILPKKWDGRTLPYVDGEFSFVISFSVLLHVPTSDIEKVFKEHVRVSKQYLFIATWFEKNSDWASSGVCFRHNYFSLFAKNNLRIIEDIKCSHPRRGNWLLEKMR